MPLVPRLLLAALAGGLAALAFEPVAWAYLLPAAVAAVTLLLVGVSAGRGFMVGTVFGSAFMVGLLPWLQVIGVDAWILLAVVQGLFYGVYGACAVLVQRLPWWPLWTALVWVAVETFRSTLPFGGFPWGRVAFATVDTPAAELMGYVGPAGTTFVVVLLGTSLAWAALRLRRAPVRAAVAVAAPLLVVAAAAASVAPWAPAEAAGPGHVVSVAAVQGDVPGEGMNPFDERRVVLENHVAATHELAERIEDGAPAPDLVVWPENSTDIDPFADPSVHEDISEAVDAVGVPVLVGAMVSGENPDDVYNQGIVWRPGTGPTERYSKNHPVPFGEYVPMRDLVAPLVDRLDQVPRDMVAGTEPGLLEMGGTTVGDVICFEVAYDDVVHGVVRGGAELLVVQTNNATYMGTGQIEQQFAIARLRAIETGRHVVIAATNGVSGIVAPDGQVVERAPVRTRAVLQASLPVSTVQTAAMRWGTALQVVLVLGAGFSVSVAIGTGLRRRRTSPGGPTTAGPRDGEGDLPARDDAARPGVPAGTGEG